MPKLDSNIYGDDSVEMAMSIASEALRPPTPAPTTGKGSEGNEDDPGDVHVIGNKSDSRAVSKDNH